MADFDSSLPIRTEAAGDVDVFISDAVTPSQKLVVESDGSINVNATFTATDLDIRDLVFATDKVDVSGSEVSLDSATLAALETITVVATDLDIRDLAFGTDSVDVSGSEVSLDATTLAALENVTVSATDLDIRDLSASSDSVAAHLFDEAGVAFSLTNPLPVELVSDAQGDEVCNYNTSASVASDASVNHDYSVTAAKTLLGGQAWVSGSGKLKVQLLVNGVTKFVGFNSTANPNIEIPLLKMCKAAATQVVRMTITNLDNQAQDVYSTLLGVEV